MKHIKTTLPLVLVFMAYSLIGQERKFGKVSETELKSQLYEKDSSAVAAVLYRYRNTRLEYKQAMGFSLVTYVHERIKIFKPEGFGYATVVEKLYKDNNDKETLTGLKAHTFNWENGKVQRHKLSSSGEFKTELNQYYNEHKFTLPNVKVGSVVEYEYRINSPFYWNIDEIALQYDIPIQYQDITLRIPEYFVFKPIMKGYLPINPEVGTEGGTITFTSTERSGVWAAPSTNYNRSTLNFMVNITNYTMEDVPALKEEPFVNNMDNYRSGVIYELQYVKMPQSPIKSYTTTWEKVVKTIYDSNDFGNQLDQHRYFKEVLPALVQDKTEPTAKAAAIFHFVQKHMNWNGMGGYFTDKGVKKAFEERTGNIADINLMLTAMLSAAGLDANPVLISTRDHGVPFFPTRKGFNYVVASVSLNDNILLLDATNKYSKPNVLPVRALNWFGKLIKEDGSFSTVPVMPKKLSRENYASNVSLDENGLITGKMRVTYTDFKAFEFRNKFTGVALDSYLEKLESNNVGMEIAEYEVRNDKLVGKSVMERMEYTLEGYVSKMGDKMFFNPLFNKAMTENPFKLDKRDYPVDFAYPWEEKFVLHIAIPEGYVVDTLPENLKIALPNNSASFIYKIVAEGNQIQLMVDLKMNTPIVPAIDYPNLKELFSKIVEKQAEQVVLSKINGDGATKITAGSR